MLDAVVPGMVLQKVVLLGSLVAGGLGAVRLAPGLPLAGRLAVVTSYQWSPLVVERLLIGHWPVLIGWACLPWVLVLAPLAADQPAPRRASPRRRAGLAERERRHDDRHRAGRRRRRRAPSAVGRASEGWCWPPTRPGSSPACSTPDPPDPSAAGAATFSLQAEGGVPAAVAALSLGGIWNGDVVPRLPHRPRRLARPPSSSSAWPCSAHRTWRAAIDRAHPRAVTGCWLVGMGVALLTWAAPEAVGWLASHVPGAGVVRDGARMLVLAAPAVATAVGSGVAAVVASLEPGAARRIVGVGLVLLPVLLLADAWWGVGGRLSCRVLPGELCRRCATPSRPVRLATCSSCHSPASAGRRGTSSHTVLDPVGRYQPRDYVSSDVLVVGGESIQGEDPRVADAAAAWRLPTSAERSDALAALGSRSW